MALGYQQYWAEPEHDARYRDFDDLTLHVEPTERAGAPLPSRFKSRLKRMLGGIVIVGGAWAVVASVGLPAVIESAQSLFEVIVARAKDMASRADQDEVAASAAMSSTVGLASPDASTAQADQSSGTDLLPALMPAQEEETAPAAGDEPSAEAVGTAYAETAEPAEEAEDKSPKRKKAIAAGLGPDLPNVLLTRLSKADLENAAYAIKTALAKTPDDAKFSWPLAPSRQQALFEVRFVQGAAEGCRRYIVTVTKDRWSSTSAALEKCGGPHPRAS